jgi:hypothetical protein
MATSRTKYAYKAGMHPRIPIVTHEIGGDPFGVAFLRRGCVNLDLLWALTLILTKLISFVV